MADPTNFLSIQQGPGGIAAGIAVNGALFLDPNGNLIMKDTITGTMYNLYIVNGELKIQEVTFL